MEKEKIAALATARNLAVEPSDALVVRLVQRQDLEIEVELAGSEVRSIGGAVRHLHWDNLEDMVGLLRQALTHAGVHDPGDLRSELSVTRVAGRWCPTVEIWLAAGAMDKEVKEKTEKVVALALTEITMPAKDQRALFDVDLDPETVQAVRDCVATELATKGGRVIRAQISAYVAGEQVMSVGGRTRSKPDKSDFTVVFVEMRGRLTGFDLAREALFFRPQGHAAIEIHIGKLDLNLVELARLIANKTDALIRLHRTTEKRGDYKYAYGKLLQENAD